ncbi:type VI secretion system-associated protein TagF [Pseudorhodoferax soli]|jgi:type VI secretion system protein ImpM|uniref:Type VI secretion system protein ImpM n=1 Tax=Pseudorhodoferax soli TaxID=545864 RepID=A0A368Y8L1_9BURK|nr:type VI secretion system-associated protein TagF [Pseudorhodoferax soli]RCW75758.1 type VI secretion system protein ImpM [Pseudorhodoferax soli]
MDLEPDTVTLPAAGFGMGVAVAVAAPPAWYGKLSMLGDFAQRRLPQEVAQACDQWLAATMHALPQVLGERWPWAYLEAPLLRFACGPGVLSAHWWFGVLMPSCDKVGRYFPLWVAQSSVQPPRHAAGLAGLVAWYDALARAAVRTLEDGATVAGFEADLAAMPPWPAAAGRQPAAAALPEALALLAADALVARLPGCTLWWPATRQAARPVQLQLAQGLPGAETLAQLLLAEQPAGR